jgi:hypothetical protein
MPAADSHKLDDRFFAQQCLLGTALQQQRIISVDMMSKASDIPGNLLRFRLPGAREKPHEPSNANSP